MSFQAWVILILVVIIVIGGIIIWFKIGRLLTKGASEEIKQNKIKIKTLTKEVNDHKKEKAKWDAKIKSNKVLKNINSVEDLVKFSNSIRRYQQ